MCSKGRPQRLLVLGCPAEFFQELSKSERNCGLFQETRRRWCDVSTWGGHQLANESLTIYAAIDQENESVQWAAAGSHVTLFLGSVDPINLRYAYLLLHSASSDVTQLPLALAMFYVHRAL